MTDPLLDALDRLASLMTHSRFGNPQTIHDAATEIRRLRHELRYQPPAVSETLLVAFTAAAIDRHRSAGKPDTPEALAQAVVVNAANKGLIRLKGNR